MVRYDVLNFVGYHWRANTDIRYRYEKKRENGKKQIFFERDEFKRDMKMKFF